MSVEPKPSQWGWKTGKGSYVFHHFQYATIKKRIRSFTNAAHKQFVCQNPAMCSFDFCWRIMSMRCFTSILVCCGHSKNDFPQARPLWEVLKLYHQNTANTKVDRIGFCLRTVNRGLYKPKFGHPGRPVMFLYQGWWQKYGVLEPALLRGSI